MEQYQERKARKWGASPQGENEGPGIQGMRDTRKTTIKEG